MRPCHAATGVGHAEIAILRVSAQTVGFEVLVAMMADGDALFRPRALDGHGRPALARKFPPRRRLGGGFSCRRFLPR